jgi:hypothetical protein
MLPVLVESWWPSLVNFFRIKRDSRGKQPKAAYVAPEGAGQIK